MQSVIFLADTALRLIVISRSGHRTQHRQKRHKHKVSFHRGQIQGVIVNIINILSPKSRRNFFFTSVHNYFANVLIFSYP